MRPLTTLSLFLRSRASSGMLCALLCAPALAHGGVYTGPGDVVPPAGGAGRPRTPGRAGPTTGRPGPRTPVAGGPITGTGRGPTTPRGGVGGARPPGQPSTGGITLTADLTAWTFWWEFNKFRYLKLQDAIHDSGPASGGDLIFLGPGRNTSRAEVLRPTRNDIRKTILPKLQEALRDSDQRDIVSSCLIAMAKVGRHEGSTIDTLGAMRERLTSKDQEIRETAALAMGISQNIEALSDLVDIATDSPRGRALTARAEVDDRTATFAMYALGLLAHSTEDDEVDGAALNALVSRLFDPETFSRNIKVAAVLSIGLLAPNQESQGDLAQRALAALQRYYDLPAGAGEQLIQAHCATAVCRLLGAESEAPQPWWVAQRDAWKARLCAEASGHGPVPRSNHAIVQSAVLALGQLAAPAESKDAPDASVSDVLRKVYIDGRDHQSRFFAAMAMGQMGGEYNREFLMGALLRAKKATELPWVALALGVQRFELLEESEHMVRSDSLLGDRLERLLHDVKNPETRGAIAVALGLGEFSDSAPALRTILRERAHQDDLAGYSCIGLALMGDVGAKDDIRAVVDGALRRPGLLRQAAMALGKLGDKSVANQLQALLQSGDANLAKMSAIASALTLIGDRHSIAPLVEMLFDEGLTDLGRAFAAVALGGVGDKEPLPWNAKIGVDLNYRAAVETLTNGAVGILDIL